MGKQEITIDMSMDVVMSHYPQTIAVLLALKMHCVGCVLSSFHSVGDAAHEHSRDAEPLLDMLNSAIAPDDKG
ncbi:DUF1858 domain-containing protein [Hoeflea sp. G2-23]|uniref:DUF1858 domain-containing protein n=1 Tax=Hoeflea algicola TaxID=2983763 RepID=A0ABT3Z9G3_9HYPH|nr:DUF1858 domain-containing protein [Hoeflea algicola]MCY0148364.1 DUF1858 domain-containing protein [Hoeflea algicola]